MGYLDLDALGALFTVDPRFQRVLRRNYFSLIMTWVKGNVPLLMYVKNCDVLLKLSCVFLQEMCDVRLLCAFLSLPHTNFFQRVFLVF
jgi:hypothetical protein